MFSRLREVAETLLNNRIENADVRMAVKSRRLDFMPTTKSDGVKMKSIFRTGNKLFLVHAQELEGRCKAAGTNKK